MLSIRLGKTDEGFTAVVRRILLTYLSPLLFLFLVFASFEAFAQFPYNQDFRGATAPDVIFGGEPTAYLTAGATPSGITDAPNDAVGQGYLRLTNNTNYQKSYIYSNNVFLGTYGLDISFEYFTYGGTGADGISFFLFDAAVTNFNIGGYGGSLGYANLGGTAGVSQGYLGIGLDEYGNFSNTNEQRHGGPGQVPNSITLRGAGNTNSNASTNYPFLVTQRTTDLTNADYFTIAGGKRGAQPGDAEYRKVFVNLKPRTGGGLIINVSVQHGTVLTKVINNYEYTTPVPSAGLKYGIASSTGGSNNYHEVRGLSLTVDPNALSQPQAVADPRTVCQGASVDIDILANDTRPNSNGAPNPASVDLDPSTPATIEQTIFIAGQGTYTFNQTNSLLHFEPVPGFNGTSTINYNWKDVYGALSTTAAVTINTPLPIITSQPQSKVVCEGTPATFTVRANGGSGTLTYLWQYYDTTSGTWKTVSGTGVSGVTSSTLTISSPGVALNGTRYQVVVTSSTGSCSVTSIPAVLTVNPKANLIRPSDQVVCNNTNTSNVAFDRSNGNTYSWTNDNTAIGLAASGTTDIGSFKALNGGTSAVVANITVTPTSSAGCPGTPVTFKITVNPDVSIALSSAAGTTSQEICIGNPIVSIVYQIANGTGATVTGLPAGLNPIYDASTGRYTISGTPTATGTFNYTVTTSGGCSSKSLSGSIKVNPNVVLALTSAPATTSQIILLGASITSITYKVTNGTGATVTGLPSGVTGSYDAASGIYTITGTPTVAGTFPYTITTTGGCVPQSLSGSIQIQRPAILLEKTGVLNSDGNTITYTFKITNNGDVDLSNLTLNDPKLPGAFSLPAGETLVSGGSKTLSATYTVTQDEKDGHQVNNTATTTGKSALGTVVTSSSSVIVSIAENPLISLVKTGVLSSDKKTITYTFQITNTGNVTLNNLSLIDARLPAFVINATDILLPGKSTTLQATYTVTQAEKDARTVNNTATAGGKSPAGTTVNSTSTIAVPVPESPGITLVKTGVLSTDNNTVDYTFILTNTGTVTLNNLSLVDAKLAAFSIPATETLLPNAIKKLTASYSITQAEKDAGRVDNTATGAGKSPAGANVNDTKSFSVSVQESPGIKLVKTGALSADKKSILYTFVITNTGTVTLKNLTLTDAKLPAFAFNADETLAPGKDRNFYATYAITQTEIDAGKVDNVATATGLSPGGTTVNSQSSLTIAVPESPSVSLTKIGVLSADKNTITYTFTIKNTGNVTLKALTLTDPKLRAFSIAASDALLPGDSKVLNAVYTITQVEKDGQQVVNSATATGKSPAGTTVSGNGNTVVPVPQSPAVSLVKTGVLSADKKSITYTFDITNTGNVTLNNLTLTDAKLPAFLINASDILLPYATKSVTATYVITQIEKDAGKVDNTATAGGKSPAGTSVNDTKSVSVPFPENPSLQLIKTGILSQDKNTITYSFALTNTGDVTLKNLTLTDVRLSAFNIPAGETLLPEATKTVTATYTVSQLEKDAGKADNTANASGLSPGGQTIPAQSSTTVLIPESPSLSLVKTGILNADKTNITYTFEIRNTGNVTLNNLTLTDVKLAPFTIDASITLAPGDVKSVNAIYAITQDEKNAQEVINAATASGKSPSGQVVQGNGNTVVAVPESPSLSLAKSGVLNAEQSKITYTFIITNTGNVTLNNLTLTDVKVPAFVIGSAITLQPGDTKTLYADYTVTQAEKDARRVDNTATASGKSPSGRAVDDTKTVAVTIPEKPSVKLVKTGVLSADRKTVTYTFILTNTGNVTLNHLSLYDVKLLPFTIPANEILLPEDSKTLSATYTITQAEKDAQKIDNTAIASGGSPAGTMVNDQATYSIQLPENPSLSLAKTGVLSTDGKTITYTFVITNTGNVTLKNLALNDVKLPAFSIPTGETLLPDDTKTLYATYTITQAEKDAHEVDNTASTSGLSPAGNTVTNSAASVVPVPEKPQISLVKTGLLSTDGKTIAYRFDVTNTGNVTLSNLNLNDAKLPGLTFAATETLAPGDTKTLTGTYTVTQAEKDAQKADNTATATGKSPAGTVVPDTKTVSVAVPEHPAVTLVKTGILSVNRNFVTYSFLLTNTGNVTLNNLGLTDAKLSAFSIDPAEKLLPGVSKSFNATYTITQAEKDAQKVDNTANAIGKSPAGVTVSAPAAFSLPLPESPAVTLAKTGVLSGDGNTILYTFVITNTGNVTLTNLNLADPKLPGLSLGAGQTLLPEASKTITATYAVTQAEKDALEVLNTANVSGLSPAGTTVNNSAGTVVPVPEKASVNLVKSGVLSTDGKTIAYTLVITNTGNVTLNNLTLTDAKLSAFVIPAGESLLPDASKTLSAVYTVLQAEKDVHHADNTATATGKSPSGRLVDDTRSVVVPIPENPVLQLVKTGVLSADRNFVTYTFTLTNTGNVSLTNLTLADPKLSAFVIDPSEILLPEASKTLSATYEITQAEKDAQKVDNTANATGKSPAGTVVNAPASNSIPLPERPSVQLVKKGVLSADQNSVIYTFTITNTGNVTLNNFTLTDIKLPGAFTFPAGETLLPGDSKIVSANYTITQLEKDAQVVKNTAVVDARSPANTGVTDRSDFTVDAPENPSVSLLKTASLNAGNNTVTYTFVITNTGNVTLNNLGLIDAKLDPFSIPATETLAPQITKTLTGNYAISQAEKDAGIVNNTATAKGKSPTGALVEGPAAAAIAVPEDPKIQLSKTGVLSADGKSVDYTFVITNTGSVTLTHLTLTDPKLPGVFTISPGDALLPTASKTLSANYVITQEEKDAGLVNNTAQVHGTSPRGTVVPASATATVSVPERPGFKLIKTGVLSADGNSVTYTFTGTNTGNVSLHNFNFNDSKIPALTLDPTLILLPDESKTFSATYTLTQAEKDARKVVNTATAGGFSPQNSRVQDVSSATVVIPEQPAIELKKTGVLSTVDGKTIAYTFEIKNTGSVTLNNLTLVDAKLPAFIIDPAETLLPGDIKTLHFSYTVTQAEYDSQKADNTATAGGKSPAQTPVTSTSTVSVPIPENPVIKLVKTGVLSADKNSVTYTFIISNEGTVTLNNLQLTDPKLPGALTISGAESLLPLASKTITATYTITQAEKDAQLISNTAIAEATSPAGTIVHDPSSFNISLPEQPAITLIKTGVLNADENTITYTFVITNTGTVTLHNLNFTDAKLPGFGGVLPGVLSPEASTSLTTVYTISQVEKDARQVMNTATINAASPSDYPVTASSQVTVPVPERPAISLTKTGLLIDNNTIKYTFVLSNTGSVTLHNLTLSDPKLPALSIDPASTLAPGASITVYANYTITQTEKDLRQVDNTAGATGLSPANIQVSNTAQATVTVPEDPSIDLVKTGVLSSDKNSIVYTFVITNTGTVTLNNLTLSDPKIPTLALPAGLSLLPGVGTSVSATYSVTQAEKDAGKVLNTALAGGVSPAGTLVNHADEVTVLVPEQPSISLTKTGVLNADNKEVTYTFTITNTGNVTLNKLNLADVKLPAFVIDASETILPGASKSYFATYTIEQAEKDARQVVNTATVSGRSPADTPVGSNSTFTLTVPESPALTVSKAGLLTTDKNSVTYIFIITNTGNVTLNNLSLSDVKLPAFVILPAESLAPLATKTILATYLITQEEKDAGHVENTANAAGKSPGGQTVVNVASASVAVPEKPSLTLVKTGVLSADKNSITYTFVITNTGNVTLKNITLTDAKIPGLTVPATTVLLPDQSTRITATYTVTQAEKDMQHADNSASVNAESPAGTPVSGTSTVVVPIPESPAITLAKAGVLDATKDKIIYSFVVKNTGNVTLTGLTLTDAKIPTLSIPAGELLLPGESKEYNAAYTITQAEKDAQLVLNTATVNGTSPAGTPVTGMGNASVPVPESPSVSLLKTGVLSTDKASVNYTFVITNTGNVTLNNLSLTDAKLPQFTVGAGESILPGGTKVFTATYLITQVEEDAGRVDNTATTRAMSPAGTAVTAVSTATVPVPENPAVKLQKKGVLSADRNSVTYTFDITNTGNVTLNNLSLTDIKLPGIVIPPTETLLPGITKIITVTYLVAQAEKNAQHVDNTATIDAKSPFGTLVTDNSTVTINVPESPAISLVKTGILSADKGTVTYRFVITNIGNVTLDGLTLTDPKIPGIVLNNSGPLLPNATETLTATYSVSQAERDAQVVNNTATATGKSPAATPVTATNSFTLPVPENPSVKLVKSGVLYADNNTVTYTFVITNTGDVTLSHLSLTDLKLAAFTIDPAENLAPGASKSLSATYTISQSEKDAHLVTNTATVTGLTQSNTAVTDVSGTDQTNDLPTTVTVPESPMITLVKTGVLNADKNTVAYTFTVTNTGNVTLKNLTLTDLKLPGAFNLGAETLLPGASKVVTAAYTITNAEKDAGFVNNTATATGLSPANVTVTDISGTAQNNDTPTQVTVPESPGITLVKTGVLSTDKNTITYTFKITNTGNVSLNNLVLTDVKLPGALIISPTDILGAGDEKIITATYTITQAEKNAGRVTNTATVTGRSPANSTVRDVSGTLQTNDIPTIINVPPAASFTITKQVSGTVGQVVNSVINYAIKVTNTGNVTLYNIVVSDPNAIITSGSPISMLDPGASVTVTASHTLTQIDADAGKVINQAVAKGTDANGNPVGKPSDDPSTPESDDPTVTPIGENGAISLVKTGVVSANATSVTFTFTIKNTGNVTLKNISLNDIMLGGPIPVNIISLAPEQIVTVTKSYILTQQDRNIGKITNTATVNGTTPAGTVVTDISGTEFTNDTPTDVVVTTQPKITLVKTGVLARDFSTITYTFLVTNTGNVTLNITGLVDTKITGNLVLSKTVLEPGQSATANAVYTISDAEKRDGQVLNTATVNATAPDGTPVSDISGTQDNNNDPTLHIIEDAPQAINDHADTQINQPVTFNIVDNDLPSFNGIDKGSVIIVKFPANGIVQVNSDGSVTYTPNRGYSGPDSFTYTVTDLKGKVSNIALVSITVIPIDLFIPNTFTPNGDGKNDTFQIIGRESFDTIGVVIFNRWGNEVYNNKNYQNNWDGSGLSEGTYYYLVTLKKGAGEITKKGWILLKR